MFDGQKPAEVAFKKNYWDAKVALYKTCSQLGNHNHASVPPTDTPVKQSCCGPLSQHQHPSGKNVIAEDGRPKYTAQRVRVVAARWCLVGDKLVSFMNINQCPTR